MITVVSGLPRSGTSLLMQMLQAGGLPLLTDERRQADQSNPQGYFEFDPVRRLQQEQGWLSETEGRAVKIVAPLLLYLPPTHDYRVLFMERALEEILHSQQRMLQRLGHAEPPADEALLARAFAQQVARSKSWLAQQPHIQTLYLSHPEIIAHPLPQAERLCAFLGNDLDAAQMAAVVDPSLYRERS